MLEKLGLGIILDANDKMSGKADRASRSMDKLGRSAGRAGDKVVGQTDRMTAALSRYARGFTVGVKMIGLGAALIAPTFLLAKRAAQTEHTLAEVRSLLVSVGMPESMMNIRMKELEDTIDRVSVKSGVLLTDLEMASYQLVSALEIGPAIQTMQAAADLAIGAKGTIASAADVLSTVLLTFGLKMDPTLTIAEKATIIADILSGTVGRFKTTLPELAAAMEYATAQSSSLGQELVEVTAAVAMLQTRGLKGAKAGTHYAAMLRGLTQAHRRMSEQAQAANMSLADFIKVSEGGVLGKGVKLAKDNPLNALRTVDELGRVLPLYDILKQVEEIFGIATKEQALALKDNASLIQLLQDEGSRAIAILLASSGELKRMTDEIRNSKTATEAAIIVNASFWNRTIMLRNQIAILSKSIGKTLIPHLHNLLDTVKPLVGEFVEWVKLHPDVTRWAVWGAVASGALLLVAGAITLATFTIKTAIESIAIILSQIGWLTSILGRLANTVFGVWIQLKLMALWTHVVTAATWLWNIALAANPIVWVILGVLALAAGIYLLIKYWDDASDAVSNFFGNLKSKLEEAPTWLVAFAGPIPLLIKHWTAIQKILDDIPTWALIPSGPFLVLLKHIDDIAFGIRDAALATVEWIQADIPSLWDSLIAQTRAAFSPMIRIFLSLWEEIRIAAISEWNKIGYAIIAVLKAITESAPFKALMEFFDWGPFAMKSVLHALGFGETFTGVSGPSKKQLEFYGPFLPAPAYVAPEGGFIGPMPPSTSETNTDYSIHRNRINIYPQPQQSPSDIAKEIDSILHPSGEF